MAMIVASPVTDVTEVQSNNNYFNDESDISENVPRCNEEEAHNEKIEEIMVKNSIEKTVSNDISSRENTCHNLEKLQSNRVSDGLIDVSKANRSNEVMANDESDSEDNDNNSAKKIVKRLLDLVDSKKETDLHGMNKEPFNINDDWSSSHLQITKYKRNSQNNFAGKIIDSESKDETLMGTINDFPQTETTDIPINNRYQVLISSESEDNVAHDPDNACDDTDIFETKGTKKKYIKKKKDSIRTSKDEAMRQIHSESQRLLREKEISLPYHRPKQRTLQEFLSRNKLLKALPKAPSAVAKLKMSSAIISQALAEKEKEAELFYKSSDSEDDTQQTSSLTRKSEKMCTTDFEQICIEETHKIGTNNHDFHKKDVQQNGEFSLIENNSKSDGSECEKYKQNSQNISVVRQLFSTSSVCEINKNLSSTYNQEQTVEESIDTFVTFLDKEKRVSNKENLGINMTENQILQISKVPQCDSKINESFKNENQSLHALKATQLSENGTSSNQISETLGDNNCKKNDSVLIQFDDCVTTQDGNDENERVETDDMPSSSLVLADDVTLKVNLSIEECKESDGHVLGLPFPNFTDEFSTDRKQLIPKSVLSSKVSLKGSPGMIIDLTDDAKSNVKCKLTKGANTLLDRFFSKHAVNTKKQTDNQSEVTVIHVQDTPDGPIPVKEILPYKLPVNIYNSELNRPGAKLLRLKEDLWLQMALKRNSEWKQKEMELQTCKNKERLDEEEESDCDLDGQEGADKLELSDSGESEPEENDVCIKDKKRRKYLFVDDEAEVTDDEDSDTNTEENESDDDKDKCGDKESMSFKHKNKKECVVDDTSEIEIDEEKDEDLNADIEDGNETDYKDDDNICNSIVENEKDRKTKQLLQEYQEDSHVTKLRALEDENNDSRSVTTNGDMFKIYHKNNNWISEDESDIPAFQQQAELATRSQIFKTPLKAKTSMLDFISPVTQLSVLNITLDSSAKEDALENTEYSTDKDEFISMERTQNDKSLERAYSVRNKVISQKKLFDDTEETVDDEYLAELCSGKFASTQKTDLNSKDLFSQVSINKPQLESLQMESDTSQDIRLTFDENLFDNSVNGAKKVDALMDSQKLIKFTSSDNENHSEEEDMFLKPKKHPVKRLNLSDSEEENTLSSDEGNDNISDKEIEEYVDYDSEENEVVVQKEIAADFVEKEAELSESDWDSVDEDEKDLDKLEFEEADDEHIDEDEVKDQLNKIHMRQVLNEDKREIRLLKELLFEDGDLHTDGAGRERKFKWKNIDKMGNSVEMSQMLDENDGWVDVQEDEEEAKWSKLKHERNKFLERMKTSNNKFENEFTDSQVFKLGLEALKKTKNNESQKQDTPEEKVDASENMEPIMPRNLTDLLNAPNTGRKSQTIYNFIKRRSLLTRGEESLTKIASLAKQCDPTSHMVNTRNFVFQYIDPDTDNISKEERGKARVSLEESSNLQNKPQKRKMISELSLSTKKRRK